MRTFTGKERTLIGMLTVIPLVGATLVMMQRATYAPWLFWLSMFVSVLATAIALRIVITGRWGDSPDQ